jgi:very-short-patch-repair endonuclease
MPAYKVVIGQKVAEAKVLRVKELRQEMTDAERILWRHLRANQLLGLRFRRQQVIDGFIVDFYCHAAGLVVELDGAAHQEHEEYDSQRDAILSARGLTILRFPNEEVIDDLPSVLARIGATCEPSPSSCSPPRFGEGPGERSIA